MKGVLFLPRGNPAYSWMAQIARSNKIIVIEYDDSVPRLVIPPAVYVGGEAEVVLKQMANK